MKKAQMEIVGLLVIVILITLMLFFGMIFLLDSSERVEDNSFQNEFQDSQLIDNFPIALFDTDVAWCRSNVGNVKSMRSLIEECFLETDFMCMDGEEEVSPCVAFNDTLENISQTVFDDFGYNVYINVSRGQSGQMTDLEIGECKSISNNYIQKLFLLSIENRPPPVAFNLKVCE